MAMRFSSKRFFLVVLLSLLTGCAGTNFVRVPDHALVLGETTAEQIKARLGSPWQQATLAKNNHQLRQESYTYASAGGEGAAEGVTPGRSQNFYYLNDKLVGYEFISSWKEDSTNFDGARVLQIKKGESTRGDVLRIVGNPGGRRVFPMIASRDEEGLVYAYAQVKGTAFNLRFHQKLLVVTLDRKGTVTDVEFVEAGEK